MGVIQLRTEIPGPRSRSLIARREAATPPGAAKLTPIAVASAHGAVVTDVDGNDFGLFISGWRSCYDTCVGGNINGLPGMIFVR